MSLALNSVLSISAPTLVKAQAGRLMKVSVIVAGSAAGGAYDANLVARAALQNQVAAIPNVVGIYQIEFQHRYGIVIVPGAGQTLAVSFT